MNQLDEARAGRTCRIYYKEVTMNEVDAGRDRVTPAQVAIRRSTMSTRRRKGVGEVHEGQGAVGQRRTGARESIHTHTHTHRSELGLEMLKL